MATDESFIDPFWICTNLGFIQTDATLEKSYGYLSALKSGVPQFNSRSAAVDSVDILDFPWSPTQPPRDLFFINSVKATSNAADSSHPASVASNLDMDFVFGDVLKKTVKNGTREETVPTFWRAGGSTDRLNFRSSFLKRCTWNLRSNFLFWTFWTKMFRWIPSQCLYVLSVSAFNLPTEIDFRSSQNHRDFYRKVGDIKWHDLNFDPTKNGRELGSCWYVHVNKPGSPQLWEQLTPEEKWWVNERKLERQLKKTGAKKKVFFLLRKFRWPLLHLFPLLDTFNLSTMNVWLLV